jgi:hypothetical protein
MVVADFSRAETFVKRYPLFTALVLSLLIHSMLFAGWKAADHLGWWTQSKSLLFDWKNEKPAKMALSKLNPSPQRPRVIPMSFVEVSPDTATPQPPAEETKFYGAINSKAANPEPEPEDKEKPKIDGEQEKIIRLADNPSPKPFPLQPQETPPEPEPEPTPERKPEPEKPAAVKKGTLEMARAELLRDAKDARELPVLSPPPPKPKKRERPRTLAAARARDQTLAGRKMKQEGGVRRRGKVALDVKATPFGAYDAAFVRAVEQRWFSLLDTAPFVQRSGKVMLEFKLNADGRITDMKALNNEVGEILGLICQRAVMDPAPYAKWPSDMRRMIGASFREVTFTFYYN